MREKDRKERDRKEKHTKETSIPFIELIKSWVNIKRKLFVKCLVIFM